MLRRASAQRPDFLVRLSEGPTPVSDEVTLVDSKNTPTRSESLVQYERYKLGLSERLWGKRYDLILARASFGPQVSTLGGGNSQRIGVDDNCRQPFLLQAVDLGCDTERESDETREERC